MSNKNKNENDATATAEPADEISEEQLESVSGGILIGLNQPSLDLAGHKDLKSQLGGLSAKKGAIETYIKIDKT